MKKFIFIIEKADGNTDAVTVEASNQGVAIHRFKSQVKGFWKIIKIIKE